MNTNINSPEFWERVKQEYETAAQHLPHFICDRSKTFKEAFSDEENESLIKIAAKEFLLGAGESANNLFFHGGYGPVLFTAKDQDVHILERMYIRLDFLDYMINRTRNENGGKSN